MMRPMALQFPADPSCRYLDRQYMLGADLLVAPVFTADGTLEFYLPEGAWVHVLDGEQLTGGRWYTRSYGFDSLGLRSEEHTSELQSRGHLVCRLLLEKKNQ